MGDASSALAGQRVDALARRARRAQLLPYFADIADQLLGAQGCWFTISPRLGQPTMTLRLGSGRIPTWRDQRLRTPRRSAAHRADVSFFFEGAPARDRVSRGQQKLLAAASHPQPAGSPSAAASAARVPDARRDPAAELDVDNLGNCSRRSHGFLPSSSSRRFTRGGLEGVETRPKVSRETRQFLIIPHLIFQAGP